jgi:hypothetical protein
MNGKRQEFQMKKIPVLLDIKKIQSSHLVRKIKENRKKTVLTLIK